MAALTALLLAAIFAPGRVQGFDAGKAGFQVRYKEETSPYKVNAVFLMPGERLDLEVKAAGKGGFRIAFPGAGSAPGGYSGLMSR